MKRQTPIPDWLMDEILDKAREIAKARKVSPFLVFNFSRKSRPTPAARGELFAWLRDNVQSCNDCKGHHIFRRTDTCNLDDVGWLPLSYPAIARIFGVDHSTVILAVQRRRIEVKKQNAVPEGDTASDPDRRPSLANPNKGSQASRAAVPFWSSRSERPYNADRRAIPQMHTEGIPGVPNRCCYLRRGA